MKLAIIFALLLASPTMAADIFVAQASAGGNTGADCADARAVSSLAAGDWTAGNILHLCGLVSSTLTAQGSGSMGNVITVKFETGASLQQAFCPASGCLNLDNRSYIVVDGGTNGLIQSTANGTGLANQHSSAGIEASPCSNCEIKNLTIGPIYIHSGTSNDGIDQTLMRCVFFSGSNWLIHNNTMHDAGWCLHNAYGSGDSQVSVYQNNIYNVDHGYAPNGFGSISASHFFFYQNHVHDFVNWDTATNSFHHDGVHGYGTNSANLTDLEVYNNQFDGNPGCNFTSYVRMEKPDSSTSLTTPLVFNNVFDGRNEPTPGTCAGFSANGDFGLMSQDGPFGGYIYNNTFLAPNTSASPQYCLLIAANTATIENNIYTGCLNDVAIYTASPSATFDYNTYASTVSCIGYIVTGAVCKSTLGAWQTQTGGESHAQTAAGLGLNVNYVPQTGSAVIGAGVNLTSVGNATLDSDKASIPRPGSGAWTSGALNAQTSLSAVAPSMMARRRDQ